MNLSQFSCSLVRIFEKIPRTKFLTSWFDCLCSFNHDKMKKLIDFVTVMPADDAGQKRGHK